MPSINSKERVVYFAVSVAACAGCLMGAGSLLLYQRLQRDARGFVEPLRRELTALRRELDDLRQLVNHLREYRPPAPSSQPLASLSIADDIATTLYQQHAISHPSKNSLSSQDDDVVEFYDAKSDDALSDYESPRLSLSISNGHLPSANQDLEDVFQRVDVLCANEHENCVEDRRHAYEMLKEYYSQNQMNFEYLWRLSRTTYLYGRSLMDIDENKRKELCFEAKDYAFDALKLNDQNADVHKWCALTIGTLGDFVGIHQKLKDGYNFIVHIQKAIELRNNDPTLRHLAGRWFYGVASLSWWERKIANAIFAGQVPNATYDEALAEFLEAERLQPNWKENQAYIALSYHYKGEKDKAKKYLEIAKNNPSISADDVSAEKELDKLRGQYSI